MKNGMSAKELLPLTGIAFSAFVFNTSEFMPIALLVDIAADFQVSESQAGILITAYAWAVCVLSLPLMVFASRFGFRNLLLGLVALFGTCQVLSALAPGYWTLMAARIGVACAHAVFWSIASPAAVRVVRIEHQSLALSAIVTGSSVAMICGLPLGRVVGLALGWRMTFFCIAVVFVRRSGISCRGFSEGSRGRALFCPRAAEALEKPCPYGSVCCDCLDGDSLLYRV